MTRNLHTGDGAVVDFIRTVDKTQRALSGIELGKPRVLGDAGAAERP